MIHDLFVFIGAAVAWVAAAATAATGALILLFLGGRRLFRAWRGRSDRPASDA
ncbi:hypothetical protein ACFUEN_29175 [Streptomyces griseorubiginosus]|uniref:hypothetical protein n=1 Tax=Streptomyces griseorubiginosus TaxID=67304 RepID=UPI003637E6A7